MKLLHSFAGLIICLILLNSCQPATNEPNLYTATPTHADDQSTPVATLIPDPSETPQAISTATLSPTSTMAPLPTLSIKVNEEAGPMYDLLFSIPVGEGGVRYRGLGVESMEITGPNSLTVLPDGRFIITDLVDNRLLYYKPDGELEKEIDLFDLDIVNVSDLLVTADKLFLKEISFSLSPIRYRVNQLSLEGNLMAYYDIPDEYRLADNLPGMIVDGEGRLLLDVEVFGVSPEFNGALSGNVIQLVDPQGNWAPSALAGAAYFGRIFSHFPTTIAENRSIVITGDDRVETILTLGFGSLRLLGVLPDGQYFLVREDLIEDFPAINVDQTVHLMSFDGVQLGAARYPLTERLYHVERGIAMSPDGSIYALLPRRNSLDIIRLNLYSDLEPLIPGAAEPLVVKDTN